MKDTVENIRRWFERVAARFKLALIFFMVLALVMAPYAYDVKKGKITKTYAIAKDGDGDDDERHQPVHAVVVVALVEQLTKAIEGDQREYRRRRADRQRHRGNDHIQG